MTATSPVAAIDADLLSGPRDEPNTRLLENTRPPDWTNPTPPRRRYAMLVIGGGTTGLATAIGAAALGYKVALVERRLLGGDRLNTGCVPTKALLRCARAAAEARRGERYGVLVPPDVSVDFGAVMLRMRELRADLSARGSVSRLRELGIDVYLGDARFVGPDAVEVDGRRLRFVRACIATGSAPKVPDAPGLAEAGFLTNETVWSLTTLPRRLAVIGAGPVGCELAQAFARLGSQVTLISRSGRVLPRDDAEAAAVVDRALADDGVEIFREATVERVETSRVSNANAEGGPEEGARGKGGGKRLLVRLADELHEVVADEILVAVGRAPVYDDLDLRAGEIASDPRLGVITNDHLRTSNPRVYAAGDVLGGPEFTHLAEAHARIVVRNALRRGRERVSRLIVPWCTYTEPELAHVGMLPKDARDRRVDVRTVTVRLDTTDRALIDGGTGLLKVYLRARSDHILGATLVGPNAGEMISQITTMMLAGRGLSTLADMVHPYPTQTEVFSRAAEAFLNTQRRGGVRGALDRLVPWRR